MLRHLARFLFSKVFRGPDRIIILACALTLIPPSASALVEPVLRFDVATFCCPCFPYDHFCQAQFDELNWQSSRGHYLAMGTDNRRAEVEGNGNVLAAYHNDLNTGSAMITGEEKADIIHQYVLDRFTANGPAPSWVILNEISAGKWPNDAAYRAWVADVVRKLNGTYGYDVLLASPFPNPGYNDADWQAVSQYAYIGIEQYLSGKEILDNGMSEAWCQSQYQTSKNRYMARGVPAARLFLFEHFGQTTSDKTWGRAGVSREDWTNAIIIRARAAQKVGFTGFASYAWGKNAMLTSDEDLIYFERVYRMQSLPGAAETRANDWEVYR